MKDKFYLVDDFGKKKKYLGKVVENPDGTYCGFSVKTKNEKVRKELNYYPEIKAQDGSLSYFSYVNPEGETVTYWGYPKKDTDGSYYLTYNTTVTFDLTYHPKVEPKPEYFTYIDKDGVEKEYTGKVTYNKRKDLYFGTVKL